MPEVEERDEYILGSGQEELERLRFQHSVWQEHTDRLLDQCRLNAGQRCLDAGGGPGFVSADIASRIGPDGIIDILEPSDYFNQSVIEIGCEVGERVSVTAVLPAGWVAPDCPGGRIGLEVGEDTVVHVLDHIAEVSALRIP